MGRGEEGGRGVLKRGADRVDDKEGKRGVKNHSRGNMKRHGWINSTEEREA
jgi:hypothetical protein